MNPSVTLPIPDAWRPAPGLLCVPDLLCSRCSYRFEAVPLRLSGDGEITHLVVERSCGCPEPEDGDAS